MFLLLSRSTTSRRTSQQGCLDPPGPSSFAGTLVPMSNMVCPRLAFAPIPLHGLCAAPCRAEDSSQHTAPSWSLPSSGRYGFPFVSHHAPDRLPTPSVCHPVLRYRLGASDGIWNWYIVRVTNDKRSTGESLYDEPASDESEHSVTLSQPQARTRRLSSRSSLANSMLNSDQ